MDIISQKEAALQTPPALIACTSNTANANKSILYAMPTISLLEFARAVKIHWSTYSIMENAFTKKYIVGEGSIRLTGNASMYLLLVDILIPLMENVSIASIIFISSALMVRA